MDFEKQNSPEFESEELTEEVELSESGLKDDNRKSPSGFEAAFDWIELFVIYFSVGIFLILCLFKFSPVVGPSMQNTLHQGDMLIVSQLPYTPENGDIIVCQSERYGLEKPIVKRVIAIAGQTVSIDYETWTVTVDGEVLDESYVNFENGMMMEASDYLPQTFTVPEGEVFVMGDNRNHSSDSRSSIIGMIDERYIIGEVKLKIYPFSDIEYYA